MKQPLIGISCSVFANDGGEPAGDRLVWAYARAVIAAGGTPVLLPNLTTNIEALLERLDGLLLAGGEDICPERYGEAKRHPKVVVTPARDDLEIPLARLAVQRGLPVLGICRGIQLLNVALGGTLYQDLPDQRPSCVVHRQTDARHLGTHGLTAEPGTHLAVLVGPEPLRVNTFHHQAVRDVAPGLVISARAEDGLVEALETADGRVVAVQYHPEDMAPVCPRSAALFAGFVTRCGEEGGH
ncbi:MAG: gamma-glutamyl-gamma-aminobutyrate hydrolase family protein [Armatimonadetes bacterium]|nr:gamma-glutamyl-gamma-aminobutyrate hydrolase family protein [Armatimonadota bacterium]